MSEDTVTINPFRTARLGQTPTAASDGKKEEFSFPSVGTVAAVSRDVLVSAAAAAVLYGAIKADKKPTPDA